MKKQILILLILSLHFSCGDGEKMDNDLTRINIKGDVKQIIETSFDAKEAFGEPQKGDLTRKLITKCNEDGNMTENKLYYADGEIKWKYKYLYEYDKKKNWTVKTTAYLTDINFINNTDEDYKIMTITEREITYY